MKKLTIKARKTIRKIILNFGLVCMIVFGFIPSAVKAQENGKLDSVAIRYIGTLDDQPLFQIEFDNKEGIAYRISITDETGETLYTEKFSAKKFSKKFKLENSELRQSSLKFTVTSIRETHTQVFVINYSYRSVPDYVITRL